MAFDHFMNEPPMNEHRLSNPKSPGGDGVA